MTMRMRQPWTWGKTRVRQAVTWMEKRVDIRYRVAGVLMALGIALFFAGGAFGWLRGAGGVVVGVGFTVFVSTLTGQTAIREQYAKDANLRRKREVYGPLDAELQVLEERLRDVEAGRGPSPLQIDLGDDWRGVPPTIPAPLDANPTLRLWREFKQDYRADDFTRGARGGLDDLERLARAYNDAVHGAEEPAIIALGSQINAAKKAVEESDAYAARDAWYDAKYNHDEQGLGDRNVAALSPEPPELPEWYDKLPSTVPGEDCGRILASSWIRQWPVIPRPTTLGWLLAGNPEGAARVVHLGYQHASPYKEPPQLEWIRGIFERAYEDIQQQQSYRDARAAETALSEGLRALRQRLGAGMRLIQDRYEGGAPLV